MKVDHFSSLPLAVNIIGRLRKHFFGSLALVDLYSSSVLDHQLDAVLDNETPE